MTGATKNEYSPGEGRKAVMKILIATDGSEFSNAAIIESCKFINPESAVIKIISVFEVALPITIETMPASAQYYQQLEDGLMDLTTENLKTAEAQMRTQFPGEQLDLTTEVVRGFPDKAIIDEANDWKADLIVVGSHGRGFWGRLLGSVSNGVVHHAPCSVLVVRKISD